MHSTPSGNAVLGANVDLRGQDVTAETARRGQDTTAQTTRRGQDLTRQTATEREQGVNSRFRVRFPSPGAETPSVTTGGRGRQDVQLPSGAPRSSNMSVVPLGGAPMSTASGGDVLSTIAADPSAEPVSPPSSTPEPPKAPDAKAQRLQDLTTTAQSALQRFQTEKDPGKKEAARRELIRIRQQIVQAQGKP